ncbi:MAG: type II toxin-antitoxin system YoeB family toxin [Proteiniphilum sp.]|jgi:toxin YoeB|uniref:type II toxin-antitoxin system YoeB family toxin n=1 Tax=Proteiniphilum sp. TaxID=1926877 RepID=UPI00269DACD9|nr:type II toxin-antitoxin system YoeB family toxin [Proteiniphilum sp.]MEA5128041.1 type II toxin-antitoxin system YoeB family toxin [Proteiniphilum sp.]
MKDEGKEYILEYTEQFIEDVKTHKKAGHKSILTKINSLIDEIQQHPTTGTGKPEALKGG